MIKERKALTMYEAEEMLENLKETDKTRETKTFIKKFSSIKNEKAAKIKKALEGLDIIKLKEQDIIKIVDLLPETAIELNKIVTEASLEEDEINKILSAIKNEK